MPAPHPRPWHRHSIFGEGRRRPLDRERRARYTFLLNAHRSAGRLTADHLRVGEKLLKRLGADGRCDPSYETLAADAGCKARTARRATAQLRDLGLLRWERRLVRAGWRAEQTSNQYELIPTAEPTAPSCGGQTVREIRRESNTTVPAELAEAQAALAARRSVVEARLLANRSG